MFIGDFMKFEIKYYLTETAYKSGVAAFKETINGTKEYANKWAENKLKSSKFVKFDIVQK